MSTDHSEERPNPLQGVPPKQGRRVCSASVLRVKPFFRRRAAFREPLPREGRRRRAFSAPTFRVKDLFHITAEYGLAPCRAGSPATTEPSPPPRPAGSRTGAGGNRRAAGSRFWRTPRFQDAPGRSGGDRIRRSGGPMTVSAGKDSARHVRHTPAAMPLMSSSRPRYPIRRAAAAPAILQPAPSPASMDRICRQADGEGEGNHRRLWRRPPRGRPTSLEGSADGRRRRARAKATGGAAERKRAGRPAPDRERNDAGARHAHGRRSTASPESRRRHWIGHGSQASCNDGRYRGRARTWREVRLVGPPAQSGFSRRTALQAPDARGPPRGALPRSWRLRSPGGPGADPDGGWTARLLAR
jgi:hypothetical protein